MPAANGRVHAAFQRARLFAEAQHRPYGGADQRHAGQGEPPAACKVGHGAPIKALLNDARNSGRGVLLFAVTTEPNLEWFLLPQENSMSADNVNTRTATTLTFGKLIQVVLLSLYCAAAILGPLLYLFLFFDRIFAESDASKLHLIAAMVLMGVLGSAIRGIARLITDVGNNQYQPSWSLSILLRPLEGAGIALVFYFAISAGITVLEQRQPSPNAAGYLFVGILAGMFSHRAVDKLRARFDKTIAASDT